MSLDGVRLRVEARLDAAESYSGTSGPCIEGQNLPDDQRELSGHEGLRDEAGETQDKQEGKGEHGTERDEQSDKPQAAVVQLDDELPECQGSKLPKIKRKRAISCGHLLIKNTGRQ
jgi:hypothetical protein